MNSRPHCLPFEEGVLQILEAPVYSHDNVILPQTPIIQCNVVTIKILDYLRNTSKFAEFPRVNNNGPDEKLVFSVERKNNIVATHLPPLGVSGLCLFFFLQFLRKKTKKRKMEIS